jgi:hypothetical protein
VIFNLPIVVLQVPTHIMRFAQQAVEHQLEEPLISLDVGPHVADHVIPTKQEFWHVRIAWVLHGRQGVKVVLDVLLLVDLVEGLSNFDKLASTNGDLNFMHFSEASTITFASSRYLLACSPATCFEMAERSFVSRFRKRASHRPMVS